MAKKTTTIEYSEILRVLKAKLEAAMDKVESMRSYENAYSYSGEEVEHIARSGFIPFTSGGYEVKWFEYVPHMMGAGYSLPTKPLQTEMERQDENAYKYAKESFIEKYPEIVEELGEDKINYSDLSEAGYESEAEEIDEMHRSYLEDASILMRMYAYYYNPENYHGKSGKHTISLQADVNLESPYHRSGNLDDGKEIDFTFTSIADLEKKMDANIEKLIEWFGGSSYNKSKTEMKIRRMESGGEIKKFIRGRGKNKSRAKKAAGAPASAYEVGKFYDDKGVYEGTGKRGHRFRRHDADTKFKEYGARYHYEKIMASGGVTSSEDMPRIYVADLAAYNEGKLIGEWLDLEDYSDGDEVMKAIGKLLKKWSKKQKAEREEYAIHDTENIPSQLYHESMGKKDFDKIYEILNAAKDSNIPMDVIMEWASEGRDVSEISDAYRGEFKSMEDFAYDWVENVGGLEGVSNPEYYVYVSDTDRRIMAGEQADADIENMDDDDILERANMKSEYDEAVDNENDEEAESILEKAKSELHDEIYNEWYDGLNDPYDFLVEQHGLYSGADLLKSNVVQFDYEKFGRDLEQDYNTVEHDGMVYVFDAHYAKGGKIGGAYASGEIIDGVIVADWDSEWDMNPLFYVLSEYPKSAKFDANQRMKFSYGFYTDAAGNKYLMLGNKSDASKEDIAVLLEKADWGTARNVDSFVNGADKEDYEKWLDNVKAKGGGVGETKVINGVDHTRVGGKVDYQSMKKIEPFSGHPLGAVYQDGNNSYVQSGYDWYKFPSNKLSDIKKFEAGGNTGDCSCDNGGFSHNETLRDIFGA